MSSSLRSRLSLLAAAIVLVSAAVGAGAGWLVIDPGNRFGGSATAAFSVGVITLISILIFCAIALTHWLLSPLSVLVRASGEVAQGRHPAEAFGEAKLGPELESIADDIRTMALRLREIDATDRQFLMSISHELRTPLTAITGHAQAIEDFAEDEAMRISSLGVIRREAERLERLIEDIVDLARLRSNRFTTVTESVWLDELGEHLLAIFDDSAVAHAPNVVVEGEFEHLRFHSDGQRILQILRNLVGNALRYASSEVRVSGQRVAGHVQLTVSNDGETISATQRDRIFEPFVGTKREGGMGLGLAIGRELAWALGGNLQCLDRADGATFELTLPLEPPVLGR